VVVMVVVALLGIALILRAWHLWPFTSSVMVTDNAYVRGQITVMAPQVNGYVTEVLVKDFQHVKEGEPLLRIDDRIYAQRVAQAQATLDSARAALANSDQSQAQNRAQIASARATLSAGQAELQRSRKIETLRGTGGAAAVHQRPRQVPHHPGVGTGQRAAVAGADPHRRGNAGVDPGRAQEPGGAGGKRAGAAGTGAHRPGQHGDPRTARRPDQRSQRTRGPVRRRRFAAAVPGA
jgi:multidrug efflux pump subunit AcrA (membrane-fusion protein)